MHATWRLWTPDVLEGRGHSRLRGGPLASAGASMGRPATGQRNPAGSRFPLPYRGYKVLEIFLYGGLSPWETFYFLPDVTRLSVDAGFRRRVGFAALGSPRVLAPAG